MKKLYTYIGLVFLSLLVSTTVFYIIGSFGSANFNLKQWNSDARIFACMGIVFSTIFCSIACINWFIEEDKKPKYMVYASNINTDDTKKPFQVK